MRDLDLVPLEARPQLDQGRAAPALSPRILSGHGNAARARYAQEITVAMRQSGYDAAAGGRSVVFEAGGSMSVIGSDA